MGQRKDALADLFRIDRYHMRIAVRPLFGMKRLVRIQRGKWNGVLFCDNIMSMSIAVTFSKSNRRRSLFSIDCKATTPAFLGEPRFNVANQATAEEMQRFHDEGVEFRFSVWPENEKTYSIDYDIYRPLETYIGAIRYRLLDDWVARYVLTLDLSAYAKTGSAVEPPQCEFAPAARANGRSAVDVSPRRLAAEDQGAGIWEWGVDNVTGGTARLLWAIEKLDLTRAFAAVKVEKLATELSVDPRVAKDLHNFVTLCHYYAAGFRSLNAIERKMLTSRMALTRSLDSIEQLVEAELIERTRSKGLVQITPAGEAILDWWSRFYTRWTPVPLGLIDAP